ncbi:MAG: serpin family protein [Saprospiraceae bacterium]|nr:serpin family protein [Saprospiraceae bacterium]
MRAYSLLLLAAMVLFSQCAKDDNPGPPGNNNKPSASLQEFGEANSALAFDLFDQALKSNEEPGKNVVVSPFSVHAALLMVLNGADGTTYEAIAKTLHSDTFSETSLNKAYQEYITYIQSVATTSELRSANAIFWDENRIFPYQEFTDKMTEFYEAELNGMSFLAAAALNAINDWVDNATNGRIDKILEEIRPEEVMFLINALYFTGDWSNPFAIEATGMRPFTPEGGHTIEVPTMSHDATFSFYQGQDYEAVDIPFADSVFSMTFIRPASGEQPVDEFARTFTRDDLLDLYNNRLHAGRLQLYLPKFETEYKINLNDALKALGMEVAFNEFEANLTRLGSAPEGNLFISRVEHKTFLKIDEKGAEGAAVTSVGIGVTSLPPQMAFDRPFMIVLRDRQLNTVIFIGKIENPVG